MVSRRHRHAIVLLVFAGLAMPAAARAQGDATRVSVVATGGVGTVDDAGATYGGDVTIRLSRLFDITIGAARLTNIASEDLRDAANTIAGLVNATAAARASADVVEAGLRVRLPVWRRVHPYAIIGGGTSRVRTETTFFRSGVETAPSALGFTLGLELRAEVTKAVGFVGAGVDVSAGRHIAIDAGVRYSGFVSKEDTSPRYSVFPVLRFQVGVGVRF